MSPTPEERAERALGDRLLGLPNTRKAVLADIATALRETETAAYERVNRELSLTYIASAEGNTDFADGVHHAIERAASLKHQEPT